jgi:hypothetical protein
MIINKLNVNLALIDAIKGSRQFEEIVISRTDVIKRPDARMLMIILNNESTSPMDLITDIGAVPLNFFITNNIEICAMPVNAPIIIIRLIIKRQVNNSVNKNLMRQKRFIFFYTVQIPDKFNGN